MQSRLILTILNLPDENFYFRDVDWWYRGESHVIKFLLIMGINPPSHTCLKDRQREVGHHFSLAPRPTIGSGQSFCTAIK